MFLATASPRISGTLVDALLSLVTLRLARALSLIKRPPPRELPSLRLFHYWLRRVDMSKRETIYQWNIHNFRNILKRVGW